MNSVTLAPQVVLNHSSEKCYRRQNKVESSQVVVVVRKGENEELKDGGHEGKHSQLEHSVARGVGEGEVKGNQNSFHM
jgi:hypothetical protein